MFLGVRTKTNKNPRENKQIQNIQTTRNLCGVVWAALLVSCAWFGYFGFFGFPEGFCYFSSETKKHCVKLAFSADTLLAHCTNQTIEQNTRLAVELAKPSGKPKYPKYPNHAQLMRRRLGRAPRKLRLVWIFWICWFSRGFLLFFVRNQKNTV